VENYADKAKLSPKQVAQLLHVTTETLRVWRLRKTGPPWYRQVGRVFYLKSDVESWEFSNPGE
jgi:DNA-binding transcriptional MerR regulator